MSLQEWSQPRHQARPVSLVQPVFGGLGQERAVPAVQGVNQKGTPLHIENRIFQRIGFRQDAAGLLGGHGIGGHRQHEAAAQG